MSLRALKAPMWLRVCCCCQHWTEEKAAKETRNSSICQILFGGLLNVILAFVQKGDQTTITRAFLVTAGNIVCAILGIVGARQRNKALLIVFIVGVVVIDLTSNLSEVSYALQLFHDCDFSQESFINCNGQELQHCITTNSCTDDDMYDTGCQAPSSSDCSNREFQFMVTLIRVSFIVIVSLPGAGFATFLLCVIVRREAVERSRSVIEELLAQHGLTAIAIVNGALNNRKGPPGPAGLAVTDAAVAEKAAVCMAAHAAVSVCAARGTSCAVCHTKSDDSRAPTESERDLRSRMTTPRSPTTTSQGLFSNYGNTDADEEAGSPGPLRLSHRTSATQFSKDGTLDPEEAAPLAGTARTRTCDCVPRWATVVGHQEFAV